MAVDPGYRQPSEPDHRNLITETRYLITETRYLPIPEPSIPGPNGSPVLSLFLPRAPLALLLFAVVLGIPAPGARAQEAVFVGSLADSIVVTATRQPEQARTTGRRVAVWTAEDLDRLPVASFDELLRAVGGVDVQSRGGFGVQSDLTMRGSGFNGVLVLLDGARLNDPMTGHFLAELPVPLAEIARIEVLRGPATALYGPDALGGVIQLFTHAGLRRRADRAGNAGSARLEGGRYGLLHAEAALRTAAARGSVGGAAAWQRSDGMPIRNAAGELVRGAGGAIRTDFERLALTAAGTRAVGPADLYVRAGLDDRDFGAYHFYTAFPSDTAREATRTLWAQARLQRVRGDRPLWRAQLAARVHDDRYVYNPVTPANEHTSRLATLQLERHLTLSPGLELVAGAAAGLRGIDSNNMGRHDDASAGLFATSRWQPLPRLTLGASARLDADPGYGLEPTPHVHAAYNRGRFTVRAAAGRAVRAPTYVERYFNTTLARPRGRNLGNPELRAERAWSAEGGLDWYAAPGLALHATAFYRHTADLIDYVRLSPADTVWLARNLLDVRTRGLEVDAAWTMHLGGRRLRVEGTYSGLDAELGALEPGVEYKYVLAHARHLLQGLAALDLGPVQLGVQVVARERLTGERNAVVNLRAGWRLPLGSGRLVVHGELRNLFDTAYADVFDAPMPDRWWIVGVRVGM